MAGAEGAVAMAQGGEGSSNKIEGNLQLKWDGVLFSEALANGMYNFMIEAVAHLSEIIIARRVSKALSAQRVYLDYFAT